MPRRPRRARPRRARPPPPARRSPRHLHRAAGRGTPPARADASVVYAPALVDPHPDHRAANRALAAAALHAEVLGYEVWSPAPAGVVLDVGGVWARGERALRCYPVALESVDCAAAAGLAAYRGATAGLGPGARAEAFTRLAPADHAALAARL